MSYRLADFPEAHSSLEEFGKQAARFTGFIIGSWRKKFRHLHSFTDGGRVTSTCSAEDSVSSRNFLRTASNRGGNS